MYCFSTVYPPCYIFFVFWFVPSLLFPSFFWPPSISVLTPHTYVVSLQRSRVHAASANFRAWLLPGCPCRAWFVGMRDTARELADGRVGGQKNEEDRRKRRRTKEGRRPQAACRTKKIWREEVTRRRGDVWRWAEEVTDTSKAMTSGVWAMSWRDGR